MNALDQLNDALDYIERHLEHDIDEREIARRACCSVFHFKRMFSFLAGIPLQEYIRRRRLTRAAMELQNSAAKVIDVAVKYGVTPIESGEHPGVEQVWRSLARSGHVCQAELAERCGTAGDLACECRGRRAREG